MYLWAKEDLADRGTHLLFVVADDWITWLEVVLGPEEDMVSRIEGVLGRVMVSPSRNIDSLRGGINIHNSVRSSNGILSSISSSHSHVTEDSGTSATSTIRESDARII